MSPPLSFEFATAGNTRFGPGTVELVGEQAARFGRRAWLLTGGHSLEQSGALERIDRSLAAAGVSRVRQAITAEPDTAIVDLGAQRALAAGCDVVIGAGGGSVLDAAKAVACLMANGGEAFDYLEVVGRGRTPAQPAVPFIAIPTTAGTGSEATRNAVIADAGSGTKASIRHESLLPRVALLDPTLTRSMPRPVTAGTGLDALVQLIEPYVSRRDHPMVDALALEGIRRAGRALPRAWADGDDADARADMMLAAYWSGIALAHCGLGASHAIAGPLGGSFPIPHGMACAATIAEVMATNLRVAARDESGERTIARYAAVARALGVGSAANDLATALVGVGHVRELCERLGVPGLRSVGVTAAAVPDLVARARRTSSMKANPVDLTDEDLAGILQRSMG